MGVAMDRVIDFFDWIGVNAVTIIGAVIMASTEDPILRVLTWMSLVALLFFNIWRGFNEMDKYLKSRKERKKRN